MRPPLTWLAKTRVKRLGQARALRRDVRPSGERGERNALAGRAACQKDVRELDGIGKCEMARGGGGSPALGARVSRRADKNWPEKSVRHRRGKKTVICSPERTRALTATHGDCRTCTSIESPNKGQRKGKES